MMKIEIHFKGQVNERWSEWLSGLTVCYSADETLLSGLVVDQSVLYGIIARLRDPGLQLTSVKSEEIEKASHQQRK